MDRYKILECISKTDNSTNYLVTDKDSGRVCVMKKMNDDGADAYRNILGISCPNIVRIYDVLDDRTVIMEYLSGTVLSLLGRRAEEYEVKSWTEQLCSAVSVLHNAGVIHRDIKPSNIMLTDDGAIKLIDFDASRIYKSFRNKDTRNIGTDGYAPPEQYGYAQTDERSDIFSIGVVMFELLTGGRPISELKGYKGLLKPVIEKCTNLDPDKRYQSVEELLRALRGEENTQKDAVHEKNKLNRKILIIVSVCFLIGGCLIGVAVSRFLPRPDTVINNKMTDLKNISLDYGDYNIDSVPVGISSMRLESAHLNKGDALHLYARITENDKAYGNQKARLDFEVFSTSGDSLGVVSLEYNVGQDEDALADMYIHAYREPDGYKYNGGIVGMIRLISIKI